MELARVEGSVAATAKNDRLDGRKLLLVNLVEPDLKPTSSFLAAMDSVVSGLKENVLVATEGRTATEILTFKERMRLRSIIIAIVDRINI